MRMKKATAFGAVFALTMVLTAFPAAAHGRHGHRSVTNTQYPVCAVEDCSETGRHYHGDEIYCGYHHEGGYCDGTCWTESGGCGSHHSGHCW